MVIVLVPSVPVKTMAWEKLPPRQVVVDGDARPLPERSTVNPFSQVPVMVSPVFASVFAAGVEKAKVGAVVSLTKFLEALPVFPAASVWETVMAFVPSPLVKVIA